MAEPVKGERVKVKVYKRGDRGFYDFGKPMRCTYGTEIEVYESSAASGPHVWLKLKGDGRLADAVDEAHAHLNVKQARALIARLRIFLALSDPTGKE